MFRKVSEITAKKMKRCSYWPWATGRQLDTHARSLVTAASHGPGCAKCRWAERERFASGGAGSGSDREGLEENMGPHHRKTLNLRVIARGLGASTPCRPLGNAAAAPGQGHTAAL